MENQDLIEAINKLADAMYDVSSEMQSLSTYLKSDFDNSTIGDSLQLIAAALVEQAFNHHKKAS